MFFFGLESNRIDDIVHFQPAGKCRRMRGAAGRFGTRYAHRCVEKGMSNMTKTLDVIAEAIRSSKHPFTKTDNRPKKAHKHRYERRKIKEYLHLGDWLTEEVS
jgi:hypothetical protein